MIKEHVVRRTTKLNGEDFNLMAGAKMAHNFNFVGKFHALYRLININSLEFQDTLFFLALTYEKLHNSRKVQLGIRRK